MATSKGGGGADTNASAPARETSQSFPWRVNKEPRASAAGEKVPAGAIMAQRAGRSKETARTSQATGRPWQATPRQRPMRAAHDDELKAKQCATSERKETPTEEPQRRKGS